MNEVTKKNLPTNDSSTSAKAQQPMPFLRLQPCLRLLLGAALLLGPACASPVTSSTAAIESDANNFLKIYEKLRNDPAFQSSVSFSLSQPIADLSATIPDEIRLGGQTYLGVRAMIAKTKSIKNGNAAPNGTIKDLLSRHSLRSDRIGPQEAKDLLSLTVDFLKSGGIEAKMRDYSAKYTSEQVLRAVNTAIIYDALQKPQKKSLSLADPPTVVGDTLRIGGACITASAVDGVGCIAQNLTGIVTDIWGTHNQLIANGASRANVVGRQVSVNEWNDSAAKESACKQAMPQAGQCSFHTDTTPPAASSPQNGPAQFSGPGNRAFNCSYKVWNCVCNGGADAAAKTCSWQSGAGSASATAGMINPLQP